MKKVMIGILILIPIIVLVVVALVSVIVSVNAHIAVEDLQLRYKDSDKTIYTLQIPFDEVANINIYNYVDAKVYPEKATNKTVEWQIVGDVSYTDENYEASRNAYLANLSSLKAELENELANGSFSTPARQNAYNVVKSKYYKDSSLIISEMADILLEKVYPAAAFVDENGKEIESNTTGKMLVSSYCKFTVRAQAETVSRIITVSVMGYDVERVTLGVSEEEDATLGVGESMRLLATYTPIDSIVNTTIWSSSDESVISVDQNGVVTALKEGRATITLKASVYSSEKEDALRFVEGSIELNVEQKGASSIFGENVVTSRTSLTFAELGVVKEEIASVEGGLLTEDGITVNADIAQITTKDGRRLTLTKCAQSDIAIRNTRFYSSESGYVLSVGENVLDLDLVWADMLQDGHPQNAVWTSSDSSVATVDENGEVKGVSSGLVTITATLGAKSVSVTINVQNKLSQIQLRTSDASLAIGIARETVFASQKYVDVSVNNDKVANSTLIAVQGQPEGATAAQLAAFYSAYNFEIVEGKEFASLDTVVRNKVVFTNAMEGMGKQKVVVKVSAKYPKYEGMTKFTTETVTLNVVYGVAVSNIDELLKACDDQKAYAHREDNIKSEEKEIWRNEAYDAVYIVKNTSLSKQTYSICLDSDCRFKEEYDDEGKIKATINYYNCVWLYGDVYGNNHKISASQGQSVNNYMIQIGQNGIKISNVILRATEIEGKDEVSNAEDTTAFTGHVMRVGDESLRYGEENGGGITIEYSIIENGKQGVNVYNADVSFTGCIVRNITQAAFYVPIRMNDTGDVDPTTQKKIVKPCYSHVNLHNIISSNTLGSLMSVAYEHYTMKSGTQYRFVSGSKNNDDDGALAKANEAYFIKHFYNAGINAVVRQTGFFMAYNWQDIDNAKLIQTGNEGIDTILTRYFGQLVRNCPQFDAFRYVDANAEKDYMHLAFIVSGVDVQKGIIDAPTYLDLRMEEEMINCIDLKDVDMSASGIPQFLQSIVDNLSLKVYGYANTAAITPSSTYQVNSALIERIHS